MADLKNSKPTPKKKKSFRFGKLLGWSFFTGAVAIICALAGYMVIIYQGQTLLQQNLGKTFMAEASILYDSNNKEVTTMYRENRELVDYKDLPANLINAVIATEDRRFSQHMGVDFWAIGRALVKDVVNRKAVEGGSTITQQLAKNMFLTQDKTFFRKATEVSLAIALETEKTKPEILEMYLNQIYFGKGAYGVKAAAKKYFAVSDLSKLQLWQMATLAGIPKSPTYYSPIDYPDKSKDRRAVVLRLMTDQGYITEAERAAAADVDYVPPVLSSKKDNLTYIDYVLDEAFNLYGIEEEKLLRGGYKIYTTMNSDAQRIMEQTYEKESFFQKDGPSQKIQSSMVIVNYKDGGIVAMIGGRDYVTKGLNRALVPRQPGSSFKPLVVYGPAIETGKYNPYSILKDEEKSYNGYSPHNYDGVYRGEVSMSEAVKKSINQPAVWLLDQIKVTTGMQFAKSLGIDFDKQDTNLAIALGGMTKGASPLQMAQAYGAFANNGNLNKSHAILKIVDSDGKEVVSYKTEKSKQVMSPKTAYYMTQLLQGVIEPGGTGVRAKMDRPVAGKTGSTQLDLKGYEKFYRDIWFVGYTPEWAAAVWEGFDKTDTKHYITGDTGGTAAIFKEVMSKALANEPVKPFVKPDGVPDLNEVPKVVADLTAVYLPENRKVKLNWSALDDKSAYRLYRKTSKESDFTLLLEVKSNVEVNDISVIPGEIYQYYVLAFNPETNLAGAKSTIAEVAVPTGNGSPSATPLPSLSPGVGISPNSSASPGVKPTNSGKPGITPSPGAPSPMATPAVASPANTPVPFVTTPVISPGTFSPSGSGKSAPPTEPSMQPTGTSTNR